ncbi:MAG: PD40 domain-containing protein [Acidobacteria bacterium]|nr:PD40 domain-containing protein [Acidobacteriota bacterium]
MRLTILTLLAALAAVPSAEAQTPFNPYFGKNAIRYDTFDWHIYETDHFEIYFYPEIEPHLERIAGYAESAYQHVSSELKHDLSMKLPLILFSTSSEFWQQNVIPGAAQEGVGAFAEPGRFRIVMPIDEPSDLLYRLIVHELTHQFQFDIIPTGLIRRNMPLWTMEGMSDYMTGYWRPNDLMTVRDAAVSDIVPRMSEMQDYGGFRNPRLIYNLGHAAFEFMEARWGKEGVRAYVFALRRSVIGGSDDAYQEAFGMDAEEWDQQFDRYMKERFKPFRDKERPADYGRDLAPDPRKDRFSNVLSIEPSPSGDLLAATTINYGDRELDIVLISTRDGEIIRNLTRGFDQSMGFEYLAQSNRSNAVPWMSWAPQGDRLAYFVRTEKDRSLIVQNVVSRKIELRVPLTIDAPESPDFSPDGTKIAFSGMQGSDANIYVIDVNTREITTLTKDPLPHYAPTWSPDGSYLVYLARVSGNDKLFRVNADGSEPTQLTFGTHDESGAQFFDNDTLIFSSTAVNPAEPIEPDVARNGQIYNLWTLNLKTHELKQYTDALTGNLSAVVLKDEGTPRIAFVTYLKGDYGLHILDRREEITTVASEDFGAPGPIVDFQAPLTHTLVRDNAKKKGRFEKLFLEGRPPVNLGVTSGGDLFGGTQIVFTDVLGDQQFSLFAASVSQYRTMSLSWINLERRFNFAVQGYSQTQFFYGQLSGVFYDPTLASLIDRDWAVATRTVRGATAFGIYPFNRYRRIELFGGVNQYREEYADPLLQFESQQYQEQQFGRQLFNNGTLMPIGLAFVQETTIFREFGPLTGSTMRLAYEVAPKIGNSLSRQTIDADVRKYFRIAGSGLLALRARGFKSWGNNPDYYFFGGNGDLRGYDYLSFIGQNAAHVNAELRIPLIDAMATPIGVLGGVRAALFANVGGAGWSTQQFKAWRSDTTLERPILGYDQLGNPIRGDEVPVSGFRLQDARASYGLSLMTFALGFPMHFDWSWRTLLNRDYEDVVFASSGGSSVFRKPRFTFWIGYDF